jgi:hypothetical protein
LDRSRDQHPRSGEAATDAIGPRLHPLSLRLVTPELDGPNYGVVRVGDPLYPAALLAFQWRRRDRAKAEELASALAPAWPRSAGRKREREHRALTAAALADAGLDLGEVAFELSEVHGEPLLDTARRWIKDGREMQAAGRDFAPYVEQVGTETQAAALTRAQAMARPPEVAAVRAAEFAARQRAAAR